VFDPVPAVSRAFLIFFEPIARWLSLYQLRF
jgi:hypothetical protein